MRGAFRRGVSFLLPVVCAVLFLSWGFGCGKKGAVREPASIPPPAGPPVAVAPLENRSNDLDASEIIRGAFVEGIAQKGWNVAPTPESDRMLREGLGISYGGQLKATTPEEVCKILGVDGVFYGEVEEWNKTTTGVYNSVSVAAAFRLYRKDGTLAWEGNDRQTRKNVPRGGGREIGAEIVGHAIVNLLMNPMTPYGKTVGRNIAQKLPHGGLNAFSARIEPAQPTATEPAPTRPPPARSGHGVAGDESGATIPVDSADTGGTK